MIGSTGGGAWGWNYQKAAFGNPDLPEYWLKPGQVGGHFTLLAGAADGTFLAVREDGSLWGWGRNESGNLGEGTNESQTRPKLIMSVN